MIINFLTHSINYPLMHTMSLLIGIRYLSNSTKDLRKKGPRTPDAPELSEYLIQAIFGLMLGL